MSVVNIKIIDMNLPHQTQKVDITFVNFSLILDRVAESTIFPLLGKRYDSFGLKSRSGELRRAIVQKGAKGNLFYKNPNGLSLTVGVSLFAIPYAKYILNGRRAVYPVRKKVLRWYDTSGNPVFSKRSKAVPPHPIYDINSEEMARIEGAVYEEVARYSE